MSFVSQVNDFAAEVSPLVYVLAPPFDQQLTDHLSALHDALSDDSAVWGPWGASSCIDWQHGQTQGELGANINYATLCGAWEDQIAFQLKALEAFLRANNLEQFAEQAQGLAEVASTPSEQAGVVVPDSADLWRESPDWIKFALIAGAALLVGKALK